MIICKARDNEYVPEALLADSSLFHTVNMTAGELEGIIGYKHELTTPLFKAQLTIHGLHDRAYVLMDGNFVKVNFEFNKYSG